MREFLMKRKKTSWENKGFTLVELIVVMVILTLLAAILVPSLLGWIDEAKGKQYILSKEGGGGYILIPQYNKK